MPLEKGSLQQDQKRKIMKNFIRLKQDIDAKYLTDYFIQEEVFDFNDVEFINGFNPNTSESRNNAFFKLLFECSPRAYDVFLDALRMNGQPKLADQIHNTELKQGPGQEFGGDDAWLTQVSEKVLNQRLSDKELSRLAQSLGAKWQIFATCLGLSQVEVEQCEMDNNYLTMQVFAALDRWRCRVVDQANLRNFLQAKEESGASVDMKIVQSVVKELQKQSQ